jgi:hypothetical protein
MYKVSVKPVEACEIGTLSDQDIRRIQRNGNENIFKILYWIYIHVSTKREILTYKINNR